MKPTRLPFAAAAAMSMLLPAVLLVGCDRAVSGSGTPGEAARPSGGAATETSETQWPTTGAAPVATFASSVHDFGRILETETQTASLEFQNTGGSTLVVSEVKTTCGCTAATLDKRSYEPGETGVIEVTFDPAGPGERQRKYVKLIANTEPAITQIAIEADVDPFVIIEPRMLELGVLKVGEEHRRTLTITATDPAFEILEVRTSNPSVRAVHAGTIDPGDADTPRTDSIEVTIDPAAPWGSLFSWLEIDVRGHPKPGAPVMTYEAKMRVQGQVFGELRATPDTFRFGAAPGETFSRTIKLHHANGEPFVITDATVQSRWLVDPTVTVTKVSPSEYELELKATAGPTMMTVSTGVEVLTNVPGEERIELPVSGAIRRVLTPR